MRIISIHVTLMPILMSEMYYEKKSNSYEISSERHSRLQHTFKQ